MIDPYIIQGMNHLKWAAFRLIQDLRWALCPVVSCSTCGFLPIDWALHRLLFMASMPMIRARWVGSNSDAWSEIWSLKWRVMSLMPTRLTACCWDDHGHWNSIVLSTFHQAMKYADERGWVNINHWKDPFKGVKNYFTDSLHQDSLETDENI